MPWHGAKRDAPANGKARLKQLMTWTSEKIGRTGAAAVAAAVVSLLIVAGYHPCDGLGPLWVVPVAGGVIGTVAALPGFSPRAMLVPGAAAVTVLAFAIGLDYSSSDAAGRQCEPVPGFAGFLLGASFTAVLAAAGLAIALAVAWAVNATRRLLAGEARVQISEDREG